MSTSVKGSCLDSSALKSRIKRELDEDEKGACSSMGSDITRPISDVELLRIMECPVCNEFPAPPIYSCEKGHFTCNSCIRLLETCSLCEAPFTQVRNFALESIIENSKFKCRNAHLGCDLIVTGAELNQHVVDCVFRPLDCNEIDCLKSNLTPAEYFSHIVDIHGITGCTRELCDGKATVILTQNEDCENISPYYIRIGPQDDKEICTVLIFSKRYRTFMCWWASCLEPEKLAKYTVTLSLDNKSDSDNLSVRWKLPLQPVWKTFDEVRDTGRCAVLPDTHLIPFSEENGWDLKVEIMKKDYAYTNFQHYYPLMLLVLVGVVAVMSSYVVDSGLNWFHAMKFSNHDFNQTFHQNDEAINQREFTDEYIGYRGFYYKAE